MKSFNLLLATGILLGSFGSTALSDEGSLILPTQVDEPITLAVENNSSDLQEHLQVFVGTSIDCCEDRKPIAGRYSSENGRIEFSPLFGYVEGQSYVVRYREKSLADTSSYQLTEFTIGPEMADMKPEVVAIYPSGDVIPENTLRFYIHFSTPMQPHVAFDHIKLVDVDGKVDDAAFMKFKQELWNEDRTRLTVLMDPGRIKRGVSTNVELGPALEAGKQYQFIVDGGWSAANGAVPLETYSKSISVDKGLRELPDSKNWEITSPAIGSIEGVQIKFDRSFDAEQLKTAIRIVDDAGRKISGKVIIDNDETIWRFKPDFAWSDQQIEIVVDAKLEDVAGNNFRDLLDHGVGTEISDIENISIPIELRTSL